MRRGTQWWTIAFVLAAQSALAQTIQTTGDRPPLQPAVDLRKPLYSQPGGPSAGTIPAGYNVDQQAAALTTGQPLGYNNGFFTVYPILTVSTFYDNNVFANNANRQSDWAVIIRP